MAGVNDRSRQNQVNIDDTSRELVAPIINTKKRKILSINKKDLGLSTKSINRFNYHFGRGNL